MTVEMGDYFPQGLDAHDPEHARLLRLAYAEWDESFQRKRPDPAVHDAWIKFVLTKTLEFDEELLAEGQAISQTLHAEMPEHPELLRPSIVINDPATKKARLLIQKYPRSQHLNKYVTGSRWKASPDTRMRDATSRSPKDAQRSVYSAVREAGEIKRSAVVKAVAPPGKFRKGHQATAAKQAINALIEQGAFVEISKGRGSRSGILRCYELPNL